MSTASSSWARRAPVAGARTYSGQRVSAAAAGDWSRLTALIAAAKHPAARAYLVDQRARLLKQAAAA